jgi:CO/xanthine dehydrogenase Mo-binding subunit
MTMPDVPKVTVELINRTDQTSKGAGEASHGPAVAAIANAVANATGKRLRDLPLDPARVKSAIG